MEELIAAELGHRRWTFASRETPPYRPSDHARTIGRLVCSACRHVFETAARSEALAGDVTREKKTRRRMVRQLASLWRDHEVGCRLASMTAGGAVPLPGAAANPWAAQTIDRQEPPEYRREYLGADVPFEMPDTAMGERLERWAALGAQGATGAKNYVLDAQALYRLAQLTELQTIGGARATAVKANRGAVSGNEQEVTITVYMQPAQLAQLVEASDLERTIRTAADLQAAMDIAEKAAAHWAKLADEFERRLKAGESEK